MVRLAGERKRFLYVVEYFSPLGDVFFAKRKAEIRKEEIENKYKPHTHIQASSSSKCMQYLIKAVRGGTCRKSNALTATSRLQFNGYCIIILILGHNTATSYTNNNNNQWCRWSWWSWWVGWYDDQWRSATTTCCSSNAFIHMYIQVKCNFFPLFSPSSRDLCTICCDRWFSLIRYFITTRRSCRQCSGGWLGERWRLGMIMMMIMMIAMIFKCIYLLHCTMDSVAPVLFNLQSKGFL